MKEHNLNDFDATIVADSLNIHGDRLTTMLVTFPRIVLAEFNTHRIFGRNSASSRAIPFKKMVKKVQQHPFIPLAWQIDHKGMQGQKYLTDLSDINGQADTWLKARNAAVEYATILNEQGGVTKQLCNRLLEPFLWHTVLVTSTEWENFFNLRCPKYHTPVSGEGFYFRSKKDTINNHSNPQNIELLEHYTTEEWLQINESQAEIHIQAVAELMWDALNESAPKVLSPGEWHLPFSENLDLPLQEKLMVAVARAARTSYLNFNGEIDFEEDKRLFHSLLKSWHASPFEHCAESMDNSEKYANFTGWEQLRTKIEKGTWKI